MLKADTRTLNTSWLVQHSPVFYGWIIMLVGTLGLIMTSPGQTYSVSIFIEHFIKDLGISRSLISTLYTLGTLIGSFALPLVGRQIDRRGARFMVVVIAALLGVACIYMGFVVNAFMLAIGFIAIRMLGQGSLALVSQNVINQWWVQRRGTVMGISGLFVALLGLGGFPVLINWLIPIYGWQSTYMILGLLLLLIMVPLGGIFFRNHPEAYGLQPDGLVTIDSGDEVVKARETNWTLPEARRTPVFWIAAIGLSSIAMFSTGLFFHMVSIFKDSGLSDTIAASVFVPIAVTSALANLGGGLLVDRLPPRLLIAIALFAQTISLLMAQYLQSTTLAFAYGIILGSTIGLMGAIHSVVWASYFGRRHLGSITGVTTTILIVGAALGPMPLGIARDILGSYNVALTLCAIVPLLLGVANLFYGKPQKVENS